MRSYLLGLICAFGAMAQAKVSDIQSGFYSLTSEPSVCGFEVRYNNSTGTLNLLSTTDPRTRRYCKNAGELRYEFTCGKDVCKQVGGNPVLLLTAPSATTVKVERIRGTESWTLEFGKGTKTKPTLFNEYSNLSWIWVFNGDPCAFKDGTTKQCQLVTEADVIKNWGKTAEALAAATPPVIDLCRHSGNKVCTVVRGDIRRVVNEISNGWIRETGYVVTVKVIGSDN